MLSPCRLRCAIILASTLALKAFAQVSTGWLQGADVLPAGGAEARLHSDIITSDGGGFNLSPQYRFNAIEHFLDITGFAVTGTTDFVLGARGKYNFLPDLPGQVGVSFLGEVSLVRDEGRAGFVLGGGTVGSKNFNVDWGRITPYGNLGLELFFILDEVNVPVTLSLGAEWRIANLPQWVFYSDLALNLSESVSRLSFGASYPF